MQFERRLRTLSQQLGPRPTVAASSPRKLVFLGDGTRQQKIAAQLAEAHPASELRVVITESDGYKAKHELADADFAYGTLSADLLAAAPQLQWLQAPAAAPVGDFYFTELVASDVTVTNMRGIYDEELSIHMITLMLAVNRQLPAYHSLQLRHEYTKLPSGGDNPADIPQAGGVDIPRSTALLVGVGNAGGETARLCRALGMKTLGVDARRTEPHDCVDELYGADKLDELLPLADFILLTIPHTPETEGLFDTSKFKLMKPSSVFVNVGRGATVNLDDLADALKTGTIGGAGLDVFGSGVVGKPDLEPLPADHALWDCP